MEQVLTQKLTKKYGGSDPAFERIIGNMVAKLIKSSGRLKETDIAALELAVKNMTLQKKSDLRQAKLKPTLPTSSSIRQPQPVSDNTSDPVLNNVNEWVLINTLSSAEHEVAEEEKVKRLREEKSRQRKWLDLQREEKRERSLKEKQEQVELYKKQVEDLKRWQEEETQKEEKQVEVVEYIKQARHEQLSDLRVRQERAAKEKRLDEEREVERCQRLLKQEEEEMNRKRDEERERMRQVLIENQKVELVKAKKREEEQEYDIKLMKEYAEKLEKEERDRVESLQSKLRRQDQISSGMALSTHELIQKRAMEDYRRAEEYQQKKIEADIKREEDEKRKRHEDEMDRKKFLDYQRQLKAEKKAILEKEEEIYASQYRLEGEAALAERKRKEEAVRENNKHYELKLKEQMKEQEEIREKLLASMDPQERQLNAHLLQKIDNEQLRERVVKRLSPPKQAKGGVKSKIF